MAESNQPIQALLKSLPEDALRLDFLMAGGYDAFPDGLTHTKTVPHTIVAQALDGKYEVRCASGKGTAQPGELFLLAANIPITIVHRGNPRNNGRMRARWIHIHFTLFETVDFNSLLRLPLIVAGPPAHQLGQIIELLRSDPPDNEADGLRWLSRRKRLAYQALEIIVAISKPKEHALEFIRSSERFLPVLTFIRKHLCESLSVRDLAGAAHLSVSQFHALFKKHMRCSPMDYVRNLRMRRACQPLVATDTPVRLIADEMGFKNQFHFCRAFKAWSGTTPSQYRKDHGNLML